MNKHNPIPQKKRRLDDITIEHNDDNANKNEKMRSFGKKSSTNVSVIPNKSATPTSKNISSAATQLTFNENTTNDKVNTSTRASTPSKEIAPSPTFSITPTPTQELNLSENTNENIQRSPLSNNNRIINGSPQSISELSTPVPQTKGK